VERVKEHRESTRPSFAKSISNPSLSLFRDVSRREIRDRCEKIKSITRAKKIASIETRNPTWTDLASEQFAIFKKQLIPRFARNDKPKKSQEN
jgi:predicted GIY-YIG superfamily endonuclease